MRDRPPKIIIPVLLTIAILGVGVASYITTGSWIDLIYRFNGERAIRDVVYQVELGARTPGSPAHAQVQEWMVKELLSAGWKVDIQQTEMMGHPIQNIVAMWGEGHPWIILGAHYDSRLTADSDPKPKNWDKPVPGANDGASGVATLLELGRVLPHHLDKKMTKQPGNIEQVWLVFFDAEDNGRIPGWDWILGSQAFVQALQEFPDAAVVIDMIGDADLKIFWEKNSDPRITKEIWKIAAKNGYSDYFSEKMKYRILDDHIPFINAGIPAVDIIDFEYPYWHTISDTPDKVSAHSLKVVGDTLLHWLTETEMGYYDP